MTKKGRRAGSLAVLAFTLFFGFSSIFNFAASRKTKANVRPQKDNGLRMGLGVLGGYGLFSNSHYGGSAAFGATFSFAFSKNIAIELAGIYLNSAGESDPDALSKGKLTTLPLQLSLLGRFPLNKKLTPYVLAGGNYLINSFSLDKTVVADWNAVGFTLMEKVDNAFGFHFGGGLEFAIGKTLATGIDVRYCLARAKGSWSMKDNESALETNGVFSGLKLNAMMVTLGLKYFFR